MIKILVKFVKVIYFCILLLAAGRLIRYFYYDIISPRVASGLADFIFTTSYPEQIGDVYLYSNAFFTVLLTICAYVFPKRFLRFFLKKAQG
ncbi:hypothetical protein BBB56_13725 [Candidatus Pantoea deserta]|uniref:Uncharacterized protein n=1 Tax=Candidatus Pantoea deserta TaxID=1869313 RepID=A0A3N4P3Q4_9GAMM|nr:hypothetical protein BBB56_13725 [Pantoea deserta]